MNQRLLIVAFNDLGIVIEIGLMCQVKLGIDLVFAKEITRCFRKITRIHFCLKRFSLTKLKIKSITTLNDECQIEKLTLLSRSGLSKNPG